MIFIMKFIATCIIIAYDHRDMYDCHVDQCRISLGVSRRV